MRLKLIDYGGICIGEILVTEQNGAQLIGDFLPTDDFKKYSALFFAYENAVNNQEFVEVDRIGNEIAMLHFSIVDCEVDTSPTEISNLQIMEEGICFDRLI